MADEEGTSGALSDSSSGSSISTRPCCTQCSKPVKNHLGPPGEGKCVIALIGNLVRRVGDLEKSLTECKEEVATLKSQHALEIADLEKLHAKRLDGILATMEVLPEEGISKMNSNVAEDGQCEPETVTGAESGHSRFSLGESRVPAGPLLSGQQQGAPSNKTQARQDVDYPDSSLVRGTRKDDHVGKGESTPRSAAAEPRTQPAHDTSTAAVLPDVHEGSRTNTGTKQPWSDVIGRRRSSPRTLKPGRPEPSRAGLGRARGLRGAEKVKIKPFHLSGISLECCPEDVLNYCRGKGVLATGCFLLRPRIRHANLTAKIFLDSAASEKVLDGRFWPACITCREWEIEPPRRIPQD